jgi:hypothetical protein
MYIPAPSLSDMGAIFPENIQLVIAGEELSIYIPPPLLAELAINVQEETDDIEELSIYKPPPLLVEILEVKTELLIVPVGELSMYIPAPLSPELEVNVQFVMDTDEDASKDIAPPSGDVLLEKVHPEMVGDDASFLIAPPTFKDVFDVKLEFAILALDELLLFIAPPYFALLAVKLQLLIVGEAPRLYIAPPSSAQ